MDEMSDFRLRHFADLHVNELALWADHERGRIRDDRVRLPKVALRVQQHWIRDTVLLHKRFSALHTVDMSQVHANKLHLARIFFVGLL